MTHQKLDRHLEDDTPRQPSQKATGESVEFKKSKARTQKKGSGSAGLGLQAGKGNKCEGGKQGDDVFLVSFYPVLLLVVGRD
jgi:hypothetical protein